MIETYQENPVASMVLFFLSNTPYVRIYGAYRSIIATTNSFSRPTGKIGSRSFFAYTQTSHKAKITSTTQPVTIVPMMGPLLHAYLVSDPPSCNAKSRGIAHAKDKKAPRPSIPFQVWRASSSDLSSGRNANRIASATAMPGMLSFVSNSSHV